ncbi:hypothetical protein N781_09050 [Pontibacillus halophilus JSM 076056 = DSM 19796]|uniref:Uncharacterized protein n=1 Tax=Pontibacillus halophilus JSM 076056 = DSM 19796 TaxID=1385510 RepID=A0A0A5GFF5_9BACI|nr:hypothetical protein [Pontibacillus halophilus]KGX89855.1 hypothetical protein N781_09050 [Pontibacillus halophilus JSM 076056 = DSM 19796]
MDRVYIHTINILIGVASIGISFILAWVMMAFAPEGNDLYSLMPFLVIAIWGIGYAIQLNVEKTRVILLTLVVECSLLFIIIFYERLFQ